MSLLDDVFCDFSQVITEPLPESGQTKGEHQGPDKGKNRKSEVSPDKGKPKGGRPAKLPSEKLVSVTTHVSPQAYAWLTGGARVMRETVSEFARNYIESRLSRRVTPRAPLTLAQEQLLSEIASLSNNVHQLARAANRDGFARVAREVEEQGAGLRQLLTRFAKS